VLATLVAGVLCLPLAEGLGLSVVWGMRQRSAGGIPEAIVTGAIVGLAQWLALRIALPKVAWWMWTSATMLGLVLGIVLVGQSRAFLQPDNLIVGLATDGAIVGAVVGLAQAAVLWPHVRMAVLWVPISIVALAPFFPTISGLNLKISQMLYERMGAADSLALSGTVTETIAVLLYALVTGIGLALLLRSSRHN
jgi:hypothetical protein